MIPASNFDWSDGFGSGYGSDWYSTLALYGTSQVIYGDFGGKVTQDPVIEPSKNKGGRSRKRRYLVEIDGQFFDADNISAVQALLRETETVAMESAARDARNFSEKIRIKPPKIRVRTQSGAQTSSVTIRRSVEATQAKVNQIYRKAQDHVDELRRAIRVREEREEEETIISLLL